jgi:hypothetical protein
VGELYDGEDEDQVEEQLEGRDVLLAAGLVSQQAAVIGIVGRPSTPLARASEIVA